MEWISVKDRLPKVNIDVLVLSRDGTMSIRYIPEESWRESWYPGGKGIGWTTHWMELPKPPINR